MLNVKHMFSVSLELPHAPVALVLKHLPVLPVFNTCNSIANQRFFFFPGLQDRPSAFEETT